MPSPDNTWKRLSPSVPHWILATAPPGCAWPPYRPGWHNDMRWEAPRPVVIGDHLTADQHGHVNTRPALYTAVWPIRLSLQ